MALTAGNGTSESMAKHDGAEHAAEDDGRAAYASPTLTYVGNLRDLLAGGGGTNWDGGGPPVLKKRG